MTVAINLNNRFLCDKNNENLLIKNHFDFDELTSLQKSYRVLIQDEEKKNSQVKQLIFGKSTRLKELEQQLKKIDHRLTQFTNLMNLDDDLLKNIFYTSCLTFAQLSILEQICKKFKKFTDEEASKLVKKAQECPDFNLIAQKVFSVAPKDLSFTQQWKKIYALSLKELKILPEDRIANYQPENSANLSFDQLKQLRTWHRAIQFIAFFNRIFDKEQLSNDQRYNSLTCVMEIIAADGLRKDFENQSTNIKPLEIDLTALNLTRIPVEITKFNGIEKLILVDNPLMYWNEKINALEFPSVELDLGLKNIRFLKKK